MIKKDLTLTVKDLAQELHVSTSTVEKDRTELRRQGYLTGHGKTLRVAPGPAGAKKELKKRIIIRLMKDNPNIQPWDLVSKTGVSSSTLSRYVSELLKSDRITVEQSSEHLSPAKAAISKREVRRPRLLDLIATNMATRYIAENLRVNTSTVKKDIKNMRKSGDPELIKAEAEAREVQARTPLTKNEAEMQEALAEIGLTEDDITQQYEDWMENAGPGDPLTREAFVTK
ncbi:HTH domain-containing protein [Candidatus Bathyarchaeota archaeon]|nr:HTH domain-containing protein [Candidatus Bathyarchaeota archaeon]